MVNRSLFSVLATQALLDAGEPLRDDYGTWLEAAIDKSPEPEPINVETLNDPSCI